eukprot:3860745-Amphidinium_carterae.1
MGLGCSQHAYAQERVWRNYLPNHLGQIKKLLWCWLRDWQIGVEGYMRLSSLLFSCYGSCEKYFQLADELCPIFQNESGNWRFWWSPEAAGWSHYS